MSEIDFFFFFEDETNTFFSMFWLYIFFCFLSNKRFLARILKLPPEKYNVKGLHVNSYITVNRRAAPKDSPRNIMEPFDEESFGLVSNVRLVLSCRTSKFFFFLFSVLLCCHRRFSFYLFIYSFIFFFRFRLFVNCKYLYKFITLKVYIFIYIYIYYIT